MALCSGLLPGPADAQDAPQPAAPTPLETTLRIAAAAPAAPSISELLSRGRVMLDDNEFAAVATLRQAAAQSADNIARLWRSDIPALENPPRAPTTAVVAALQQAAITHFWWGRAADTFNLRDEAITALSRAVRYSRVPGVDNPSLARDSLSTLMGVLRFGLPQVVSDDAINTVSSVAHVKLWVPRRFSLDLSSLETVPGASAGAGAPEEFLLTDGKVFPPEQPTLASPVSGLSRVPPLYRGVPPASLPAVLQLDTMVAGYVRETVGPNRGLWRMVVRVFYPSVYVTRERRDDRPRAQAICAQFLRLWALYRRMLSVGNRYDPQGVTTIWLSEFSAWWPNDEDDVEIRAQLGVTVPEPTTEVAARRQLPAELDPLRTPLLRAWRDSPAAVAAGGAGAAQLDSDWGEIIVFKTTQSRAPIEWFRELAHEYGHVSLPPLGGFSPPLEYYANGTLGETLSMLWTARLPSIVEPDPDSTPDTTGSDTDATVREHIENHSLASLSFFMQRGPFTELVTRGNLEGLRYLQGLTVYIERVYGSRILAQALQPALERTRPRNEARTRPTLERNRPLQATVLMESLARVLQDPFKRTVREGNRSRQVLTTLPVWLGSAMHRDPGVSAPGQEAWLARSPLSLKAGERISLTIFIPPAAGVLHTEWRPEAAGRAASLRFEGDWVVSTRRPTLPGATVAVDISCANHSGWQNLSLVAGNDVILSGSWFISKEAATPAPVAAPAGRR